MIKSSLDKKIILLSFFIPKYMPIIKKISLNIITNIFKV